MFTHFMYTREHVPTLSPSLIPQPPSHVPEGEGGYGLWEQTGWASLTSENVLVIQWRWVRRI